MAATAAILIFCDDYSSRTKNGRDMWFSPKRSVVVEEPPILNLMSYNFQTGGYDVLWKTRFPPKVLLGQKWSDLDGIWYVVTYGCSEWVYAVSIYEKINNAQHDLIISDFSKWFNLLHKYSSWCAYSYYVVFTLIKNPIWQLFRYLYVGFVFI